MTTTASLAETLRSELKAIAIQANVRALSTGAVRIDIGSRRYKARQFFTVSEQEDIRTIAAGRGLHWAAPEFGPYPVRAGERSNNPETFTFYGE